MLEHFVSHNTAEAIRATVQYLLPYKYMPIAAFGAFLLYVTNRSQDKQPWSLFYAANVNVGKSGKPLVIAFDMALTSIVGGVVVLLLTWPTSCAQAILAGFGWTGILSVRSKKMEEKED